METIGPVTRDRLRNISNDDLINELIIRGGTLRRAEISQLLGNTLSLLDSLNTNNPDLIEDTDLELMPRMRLLLETLNNLGY